MISAFDLVPADFEDPVDWLTRGAHGGTKFSTNAILIIFSEYFIRYHAKHGMHGYFRPTHDQQVTSSNESVTG